MTGGEGKRNRQAKDKAKFCDGAVLGALTPETLHQWSSLSPTEFPKAQNLAGRLLQEGVGNPEGPNTPEDLVQRVDTLWDSLEQRKREIVDPDPDVVEQEVDRVEKDPDLQGKLLVGYHRRVRIHWLSEVAVTSGGLSALAQLVEQFLPTREERGDPLFPGPLIFTHSTDRRVGNPFSQAHWASTGVLPKLNEQTAKGPIVPALPLALYRATGGPRSSPGSGAPLEARLFTDAVLMVPLKDRTSQPVVLPQERYGDFLERIYPSLKSWRRGNDHERVFQALERLGTSEFRVPCFNPDNQTGGMLLVVWPVQTPISGHKDDVIQFAVHLPPGKVGRGVIIDRRASILAGVKSGPAWCMLYSLAAWWQIDGKTRVPVGGARVYRQVRKVEHYPPVSDAELVAMAFPLGVRDHARQRAEKALRFLQEIGYAQVHTMSGQRVIMPAPRWAGWNENAPQGRQR